MTQARITTTGLEVVVEADADARISGLALEVVHSAQEAPPEPPPAGGRRAVVIVMG